MTQVHEDQKKQAFDIYIRILAAAPDSLIKSLTGKEMAKHAVEGAIEIRNYLFPEK